MEFTGFPVAALDFYDDLEVDNTKSFWEKHKHVYDESVKAPMAALCDALGKEFGDAQDLPALPRRPVRQGQDALQDPPGCLRPGRRRDRLVRRGLAARHPHRRRVLPRRGPRLAALREAIAHDTYGAELEKIIRGLERKGFTIGGDVLKTTPRGYGKDHPRIDLLRHKSIIASRTIGFEPVIHTAELLDLVRKDWRATRPLVEWAQRHGAH